VAKRTQAKNVLIGYRNADPQEVSLAVGTTPVPIWTNEDGQQGAIASLMVRGGLDNGTFTITIDGVAIPLPLKTNNPLTETWEPLSELYVSNTKQGAPNGGITLSSSATVSVDYRLRIIG
jgi:hypothetical protein